MGDSADFSLVDSLEEDFSVIQTWIKGEMVAKSGKAMFDSVPVTSVINNFNESLIKVAGIARDYPGLVRIIVAQDTLLLTLHEEQRYTTDENVLKIDVVNRY